VWSEITIYHLLTHTSGIYSYTDSEPDLRELMFSDVSSDAVIDSFIDKPLQFEPGTDWSYSNSGYHLLGDIIARASDSNYAIYLKRTFFDPLGMDSTRLEGNISIIPHRAEGYVSASLRADYLNMNVPYSAGALISTVEDLFLWNRALYTGQIVPQETLDAMWERAATIDDSNRYGYGLGREVREGQDFIWHGGGINGFLTALGYLPEHDLTLIILTNRENPAIEDAMSVIFDAMVAEAASS
jgi:CubicO group peptidase (beta-lactamase class C family)